MEPGPPPHLGDKSAAPAFTHKIPFYSLRHQLFLLWGRGGVRVGVLLNMALFSRCLCRVDGMSFLTRNKTVSVLCVLLGRLIEAEVVFLETGEKFMESYFFKDSRHKWKVRYVFQESFVR